MKTRNLFVAGLLCLMTTGVINAQDGGATDENLRRYALMMEVVDVMKKEISDITNDMIKSQEGMTGQRYLELRKGDGEPAKEYEQKFMDLVEKMQEERKDAIKEVLQILATKMMPDGGKAYNEVKTAIKEDAEIKAKYEGMAEELKG